MLELLPLSTVHLSRFFGLTRYPTSPHYLIHMDLQVELDAWARDSAWYHFYWPKYLWKPQNMKVLGMGKSHLQYKGAAAGAGPHQSSTWRQAAPTQLVSARHAGLLATSARLRTT